MHAKVTEDPFGEDHRPCGRRPDPVEEFPAGVAVGQVQTDPLDRRRRNLGAQLGILAFDEAWMVNLDPVEGWRKIHPVRAGVDPSPEVDDRIDPDQIAERMNASIRTVRMATTHAPIRPGPRDPEAALPRSARGERIAEQGIRPARFHCAPSGSQQGRFRHALDGFVSHIGCLSVLTHTAPRPFVFREMVIGLTLRRVDVLMLRDFDRARPDRLLLGYSRRVPSPSS